MSTIRKDYSPEIRSCVQALVAAGFTLRCVDDGGDELEKVGTVQEAVEAIEAVEEARLFLLSPDGKRCSAFFVLGNSPGELVADYSANVPLLDKILMEAADAWTGKDQPVR